jgi:hypothetical protein
MATAPAAGEREQVSTPSIDLWTVGRTPALAAMALASMRIAFEPGTAVSGGLVLVGVVAGVVGGVVTGGSVVSFVTAVDGVVG